MLQALTLHASPSHGSCDAGGHVVKGLDAAAEAAMTTLGRRLHLAAHAVRAVGEDDSSQVHMIVGPTDMEVHRGDPLQPSQANGSLYVLDSARLFPPESPSARLGRHQTDKPDLWFLDADQLQQQQQPSTAAYTGVGIMYRLLRPELLAHYKKAKRSRRGFRYAH